MQYVAVITSDGYPSDDDVRVFGTAAEAWQHLADERRDAEEDNACDETCEDGPACAWSYCADLTETWTELVELAQQQDAQPGTVEGATPGYHGVRDVPMQYTVRVKDGSEDVTR